MCGLFKMSSAEQPLSESHNIHVHSVFAKNTSRLFTRFF